jgi:hypothetical protein
VQIAFAPIFAKPWPRASKKNSVARFSLFRYDIDSRKEKILYSPNHTIVRVAPQVLRIPAYARKHLPNAGPFAKALTIEQDEKQDVPKKGPSLEKFVWRGLAVVALVGAAIIFSKVYM